MKRTWTVFVLFAISGAARAAMVTIGAAGNDADTNGVGSVAYTYRISQYEVTGAEFQEAVDSDSRIGESTPNSGDAPAAYVSWCEAAKYCNWRTTGDAYSGAYSFDIDGNYTGMMTRAQILATGSLYYLLPTLDEWHKAAYFKDGVYSLYANGTDTAPTAAEARYGTNSTWAVGSGAAEQNGTYDMMGNVYEWTETVSIDDPAFMVLRGGYYETNAISLSSSSYYNNDPLAEEPGGGLRIVAIPEPATALLLGLGVIGACLVRSNLQRLKDEAGK